MVCVDRQCWIAWTALQYTEHVGSVESITGDIIVVEEVSSIYLQTASRSVVYSLQSIDCLVQLDDSSGYWVNNAPAAP
jgi:hypothetical protein